MFGMTGHTALIVFKTQVMLFEKKGVIIMTRTKYRYILCGTCRPDDIVGDFRLIGGNNLRFAHNAIRIEIPVDMALEKFSCDSYATTESKLHIRELNPKVCTRINTRMTVDEDMTAIWLKGECEPHEFYKYMEQRGYESNQYFGYVTNEQYIFLMKYHLKAWQLTRLPNTGLNSSLFVKNENYPNVFARHIKIMHEFLDKHEDLKIFHDVSDVRLVDLLGCACRACDKPVKLQSFTDHIVEHYMADKLKEMLHLYEFCKELGEDIDIDSCFA